MRETGTGSFTFHLGALPGVPAVSIPIQLFIKKLYTEISITWRVLMDQVEAIIKDGEWQIQTQFLSSLLLFSLVKYST